MAIFVPHDNVENNESFGRAINKVREFYIEKEVAARKVKGFTVAGIEIFDDGNTKVYLDLEVQISIKFKKNKIKPSDKGKLVNIDLQEIEDLKWYDKNLNKNSAKILVIRFNKNWWVYYADYKKRKELEDRFKVTQTFRVRGGGYLPLDIRREQKHTFLEGYRAGLENELPLMWKRHITVSQRYNAVMVYDGNYFDLFAHAQELYVLGFYYSSIIICRAATEQALIKILINKGMGLEIYRNRKKGKGRKLKGIQELIGTCKDKKLFKNKKYPINKWSEKKLTTIAHTANDLVHLKHDLDELENYKFKALECMDNLQYVIKNHLNFIRDTGVVSGYKIIGNTKRLK